MLFAPYVCFIFLLSLCNLVAANWEIAAHSAYDMLSKYKYLVVNLVFPSSVFGISFTMHHFLIITYFYL